MGTVPLYSVAVTVPQDVDQADVESIVDALDATVVRPVDGGTRVSVAVEGDTPAQALADSWTRLLAALPGRASGVSVVELD